MGEMKQTPGPWTVAGENAVEPDVMWGECFVAQCFGFSDPDEALANARLIAEAGTVFHNTGLSPVQLVEMVKELKAAVRGLDEAYCRSGEPLGKAERHEDRLRLIAARAALSKCEGVKP